MMNFVWNLERYFEGHRKDLQGYELWNCWFIFSEVDYLKFE